MPELETPTECVLTLTEAGVFLWVSDKALADKATAGEVPACQIGGEWRFLRRALVDWLYAGARESANRMPGTTLTSSKATVFRHFGILAITKILKPRWQTSPNSGRRGRAEAIHDRLDTDIFTLFAYGRE
jgi:hypothetical protein